MTPTPLKTRVLLADDHAVVRSGLKMVLDSEPDIEVIAEAGDGAEAVQKALSDDVDLAILDVAMPRMTGLQAVAELHRRRPGLAPGGLRRSPAPAARRGASRTWAALRPHRWGSSGRRLRRPGGRAETESQRGVPYRTCS